MRNKLESIKKDDTFVVSVAIPLTTNRGVINRDYYGLVLASGATSVIEAFLKGYIKILKEHSKLKSLPLFPRLEHEIKNILKRDRDLSLWNLKQHLFTQSFPWFSWKEIVNHGYVDDFPTIDNIIDAMNKLYEEGKITIKASKEMFYKRKKGLDKNKVKKKQKYLKEIRISLKCKTELF